MGDGGGSYYKPFLSTPSARRATVQLDPLNAAVQISIHALREEGDPLGIGTISPIELISIHALREEGDADCSRSRRQAGISIHALREEGDNFTPETWTGRQLFLSTPSARRATRGPPR